ncbi:MAG: hypothetical protein A4E71_01003 [Smithella sp. PtaU1.Bin162]|nr:MAG: hypothetical protein A4E71_01003 [Smithella sp. PtaU1.Bin162]
MKTIFQERVGVKYYQFSYIHLCISHYLENYVWETFYETDKEIEEHINKFQRFLINGKEFSLNNAERIYDLENDTIIYRTNQKRYTGENLESLKKAEEDQKRYFKRQQEAVQKVKPWWKTIL